MQTLDFDYDLPAELIAQVPAAKRDHSRLLVLDRTTGNLSHRRFSELITYLHPGDLLVLNNSKVIPARLRGVNARTEGAFEILLLQECGVNEWWALLRPGRRARPGTRLNFFDAFGNRSTLEAVVDEINSEGHRKLFFHGVANLRSVLEKYGEIPLPPYIQRTGRGELIEDQYRYQTVFAQLPGSIAAPTAGLHFTEELLKQFQESSVEVVFVTLHVGLGTFAPVKSVNIESHKMHEEHFEVSPAAAEKVNQARRDRRRVFAVGTSSLRVLESAANPEGMIRAGRDVTRLFIYPPFQFKIADALVTNFHLPKSTLLMLVSAFASPGSAEGREIVLAAYQEAIREKYRFYSYGDAMVIL